MLLLEDSPNQGEGNGTRVENTEPEAQIVEQKTKSEAQFWSEKVEGSERERERERDLVRRGLGSEGAHGAPRR